MIGELEFLLEDCDEDTLGESMVMKYRDTIVELQNLLATKLDESTVLLLKVCNGDF